MDAMPKISIIIPAYNVEQYIQECLESCINQTYQNIEIIIIDDSSTDWTFDICKQYQQQDSRIMLRQNNQNKGVSYSRNKGLDVAKGEYILFVDADDIVQENLCETALKYAKVNGGGTLELLRSFA